jgi:hypothetical protein
MTDHTFSVSHHNFIQKAVTRALAAPFIHSCSSNTPSPDKELNHACICIEGVGWSDLQKFKEDPNVQVVAIYNVDAVNMKFLNNPDANKYLRRTFRDGGNVAGF